MGHITESELREIVAHMAYCKDKIEEYVEEFIDAARIDVNDERASHLCQLKVSLTDAMGREIEAAESSL